MHCLNSVPDKAHTPKLQSSIQMIGKKTIWGTFMQQLSDVSIHM